MSRVINLPCGPVRARLDKDGILVARGIKYAEAKRFEYSSPVAPWTEVRDCTGPAKICPQNPSGMILINGPIQRGRTQHEDCLELTVAAHCEAQNAPVMVFIHGGAYMTGGGDLDVYQPTSLARHGRVVAVSITYRLGVFGYLGIEGIAPANRGLFDQIEALQWIQKNISAFGGDPSRVTLFGQSAGGDSILCLLVSDIAKGLFHRAIMQSAPIGFRKLNFDELCATASEQAAVFFAGFNDLSTPSTSELLEFQEQLRRDIGKKYDAMTPFAPVFGVHPLPRWAELEHRLVAAAKDIPILIGYTQDEGTVYAELFPHHAETDFTDGMFKDGANQLHRAVNGYGIPSALYRFNWHPNESVKYKAVHCIELPFLLGDWDAWKDAPMLKGQNSQKIVEELGVQVKNLWVAFANGASLGSGTYDIDAKFKYPRTQ